MKIEFTNRAVRDLREISGYCRKQFGDRVTAALEARIRDVVTNIADFPERAPRVEGRPRHASGAAHSLSIQDFLSNNR